MALAVAASGLITARHIRVPKNGRRPPSLPPRGARLVSAALRTADDPGVDWVEATAEFFREDTRPIMLFDGVCNLCNGGVRFVRGNDPNRRIRFEALQSDAGRRLLQRSGRAPDDISSVVLVEKDRSYIKSEAVARIMEYLRLPFPQLAFFLRLVPLNKACRELCCSLGRAKALHAVQLVRVDRNIEILHDDQIVGRPLVYLQHQRSAPDLEAGFRGSSVEVALDCYEPVRHFHLPAPQSSKALPPNPSQGKQLYVYAAS